MSVAAEASIVVAAAALAVEAVAAAAVVSAAAQAAFQALREWSPTCQPIVAAVHPPNLPSAADCPLPASSLETVRPS